MALSPINNYKIYYQEHAQVAAFLETSVILKYELLVLTVKLSLEPSLAAEILIVNDVTTLFS